MRNRTNAMRDTSRILDAQLLFRKRIDDPGSTYSNIDDYEDYKTIWAESRYLSGRNRYAARAQNVKTTVQFIIPWRDDLDESMQIVYEGRTYDIEGILPLDNTRIYKSISAYEVKHDEV